MEKQHKNQVKKYISWGLLAVLVALLAFMPLLAGNQENTDGPQASVLSGTVERTDIANQLIGGGTLKSQEAVAIEIPAAVKLTGYLVGNGDTVEEGDVIATVDRVTVMTAITQVQETLDYLAEEIEVVSGEEAPTEVIAQAGGTVKIIYAEEGEAVQEAMLEHGALAVLSLDGLMAVQVERSTGLSAGDTVCVTLSDGSEVDGKVEANQEGILTVTIEDDGYPVGGEVTVSTEDGGRIGSGKLYIHSQWNAVAYSGTVDRIRVSEGDTVAVGWTLIDLEDTGHTAGYQQMVNQHQEYEELMLELFRMYQSESLTAPCAGVVSGVDENGTYMLSDSGSGWFVSFLTNAPNGDDETSYINYIGQVASVGLDGLIMRMNPQQLSITDYKDLSGVHADTALMTEEVIYAAQAPVYELVGGEWTQIEASAIAAGDVLLFAGDANGNMVWVVRVSAGAAEPDAPEPSEPVEPSEPTEPTQPEESEQGTDPAAPTEPDASAESATSGNPSQSGFPQSGGSFGGSGMTQEEEEYELYALETVSIASVTSQEEMTVEITLDELDITKVFVGQSASVTMDALSGQVFTATVTQIAGSGESEGGNSKFTVELTLDKSGDMLPGMNASVVIILGTLTDAVSVPVAALVENGPEVMLYTSYDAESGEFGDSVTVTVGVSDGDNAEILSGIEEGMTYYYPYYDTLVISDTPDMGGFSFGFGRR